MFNFQHSQITQKEFEQLANILLKYPEVKFDVGKVNSPLYLPLKPDAVFKKQAEIKRKSKETENLKLQYVNNIQTTSQINLIHDSDTELS